jgi:hypothetical protein
MLTGRYELKALRHQPPITTKQAISPSSVGLAALVVLGAPDSQELYDKNKQYEKLTRALTPLRIAKAGEDTSAFLLSLDLRWHACRVHNFGGPLWITGAKTVGGMSGSPCGSQSNKRALGVS